MFYLKNLSSFGISSQNIFKKINKWWCCLSKTTFKKCQRVKLGFTILHHIVSVTMLHFSQPENLHSSGYWQPCWSIAHAGQIE